MGAFLILTNDKKLLDIYIQTLPKHNKDVLVYIEPKTKEYSIDQIKEINEEITISQPYHRWYIFENFHNSSLEAQNAFLKSLEESSVNVSFILSTPNIYSLIPTIISRTKIIELENASSPILNNAVKIACDDFLKNRNFIPFHNKLIIVTSKEQAIELFIQLILYFRNRLLKDNKSAGVLQHIIKIKSLLDNNNLNPQMAIDNVLIFIKKTYNIKIKQ